MTAAGWVLGLGLLAWTVRLLWVTSHRVARGDAFQPTVECARKDTWLACQLTMITFVLEWAPAVYLSAFLTVVLGLCWADAEGAERRAREQERRDRGGW